MTFAPATMDIATRIIERLSSLGKTVGTAESCTGGLVAGALTAISGSSQVYMLGHITYSNQAKIDLLAVPADMIAKLGAVSNDVAAAMASGLLARHSNLHYAITTTGIAGPTGGSAEKPVGLVYIAFAANGRAAIVQRHQFTGDRTKIRDDATHAALELLWDQISANGH
jgi:nicotinamide-nucleotide amidase